MIWLLAACAFAWDTTGSTWIEEDRPVQWWLDANLPAGMDQTEALAAVQASFDTWEQAECGIAFEYMGRVSDAVPGGTPDGRNVIFILESWPFEASLISTPELVDDGVVMVEADIALNAQYFTWVTTGADGRTMMDLESGVTHEIGHLLGLWHSTEPGATMSPAMNGHPDGRSLEADDVEGLCALYGETAGEGELGDTCEDESSCNESLICLLDGAEQYCTETCDAGACPDGYECLEAGGDSVCAKEVPSGCGCDTGRGALALLWLPALLVLRRRS